MEQILKSGKAKAIGVSNYPANILREMTTYASVMPAVNQIEFTTNKQQPAVLKAAKELGVLITGYSTNRSILYHGEASVLGEIAKRDGRTPSQVALKWANQRGVVAICGA